MRSKDDLRMGGFTFRISTKTGDSSNSEVTKKGQTLGWMTATQKSTAPQFGVLVYKPICRLAPSIGHILQMAIEIGVCPAAPHGGKMRKT